MLERGSEETNNNSKQHSVKVPRLYKVASNILKDFHDGKDSIKNLVFNCKKHPNTKALFALVMETANHSKQIDEATKKIQLFETEPRFNRHLAFVLINELFWGKETLPGDSLPVQTVLKYKKRLKKTIDLNLNKDLRALDATWPRYARVNTLCNNQHRVTRHLREEGWLEVMYDKEAVTSDEFLDLVAGLREGQFLSDLHVPNLLVFPPKTPLYQHDLVKDGSLMLQDKSSCFPVAALNPPAGSCVLDACAAPGMKTSQLAAAVCGDWVAALGGQPPSGAKVIAVERSSKRFSVLCDMLSRSRADSVTTPLNSDFLDLEHENYPDVEYIVLDPSCSGTGMAKRGGDQEDPSPDRLLKLASLQMKLLNHALGFPGVKKVVYSTCAVSEEENERVVSHVLDGHPLWKVIPAMSNWKRRGFGTYGDKLIRADPDKDWCNGFFVAVLEKSVDDLDNYGTVFEKKKEIKINLKVKDKSEETSALKEDVIPITKKKKKKKDKDINKSISTVDNDDKADILITKKKKKKKDKENIENNDFFISNNPEGLEDDQQIPKKKKKKKDKNKDQIPTNGISTSDNLNTESDEHLNGSLKKKKKRKLKEKEEDVEDVVTPVKKKKKKDKEKQ